MHPSINLEKKFKLNFALNFQLYALFSTFLELHFQIWTANLYPPR